MMASIDWCYKNLTPAHTNTYLTTTIITSVINIVAAPIAASGNILILVLVWKYPNLRKPCHMLVISLCITDALVGILIQPVHVVFRLLTYHRIYNCPLRFVYVFGSYLVFNLTIYNVALISVDRYIAIIKPYKYPSLATRRNYGVAIGLLWLIITLITIIMRIIRLDYMVSLQTVLILLPLMVILTCYGLIYFVIIGHRRRIAQQISTVQRHPSVDQSAMPVEPRRTNTAVVIVIALLVCYGPQVILWIYRGIFEGKIADFFITDTWIDTIVFVNSSLNPFIYCFRIEDFKTALRRMYMKNNLDNMESNNNVVSNSNVVPLEIPYPANSVSA